MLNIQKRYTHSTNDSLIVINSIIATQYFLINLRLHGSSNISLEFICCKGRSKSIITNILTMFKATPN